MHTCASLEKFPRTLVSQSSDDPPEIVRVIFAVDVIKRWRQLILLLRECTTSYTASYIIADEKRDTLSDALTLLVLGLHPFAGPKAVVHVDSTPAFVSLSTNDALKHIGISIEVGRLKNKNKNPVAERAAWRWKRKSCA